MPWIDSLTRVAQEYLQAAVVSPGTGSLIMGEAAAPTIDLKRETAAKQTLQARLDRHVRTATVLLGIALLATVIILIGGMILLWEIRDNQDAFKPALYLLAPLLVVLFSFTLTLGTRVAALGMISAILGDLRPESRPGFIRSVKWLNGEGSFRPLAQAFLKLIKPQ